MRNEVHSENLSLAMLHYRWPNQDNPGNQCNLKKISLCWFPSIAQYYILKHTLEKIIPCKLFWTLKTPNDMSYWHEYNMTILDIFVSTTDLSYLMVKLTLWVQQNPYPVTADLLLKDSFKFRVKFRVKDSFQGAPPYTLIRQPSSIIHKQLHSLFHGWCFKFEEIVGYSANIIE